MREWGIKQLFEPKILKVPASDYTPLDMLHEDAYAHILWIWADARARTHTHSKCVTLGTAADKT